MNGLFDLTGKVAIITGSTKGIGKSIAEEYAKAGAKVVISSRKADACQQVADELRSQGFDALPVACHVGDKAQLQNLVDRTLEAFGRIDVLVCNAATNPVYGPTHTVSDEAFDKIMGTNVKGTFWLCNMVIPHMVEQGGGSIVLLSSIAGLRASANIGVYGMSKAAEAGLARNLSLEWGPQGIRVNSIAPGPFPTEGAWKRLMPNPQVEQVYKDRQPSKRFGEPEELANLAVFLMSDLAAYITGETVVIDGGERLQGGQFNFVAQMMPREQLKQMFAMMRPGKSDE